jgi:mono/diheme cytochrome c family protein
MRTLATVAITTAALLTALAAGAAVLVGSGVYNIGADDHHTQPVFAMIEALREHSIDARSRTLAAPDLGDPARVRRGATTYAAHCPVCHLAPGVDQDKAGVRRGMYPHPPNLSQEGVNDPRQAFWIIKHGIKMSAMPSWAKTLDDDDIWDVVAFLRKAPDMAAEQYQTLSSGDH